MKRLTTFFTLTALSLGGASAAVTAGNLLALYDYNGNANDSSGNAPNATLEGGAVISADGAGYSGNGGDSALDVTALDGHALTTGLDLSTAIANNSMAVSFWQFNLGDGAGNASQSTAFGILGTGAGNAARGFGAHTTWSDGNIYFDHSGCCAQPGQRLIAPGVGNTLVDGWHHIVLQVDNGAAQIWVDGSMLSEHTSGADAIDPTLTGELRVGLQFDGVIDFEGRLDEFAVWNTSLSAGEIGSLAGGAATQSILVPEPSSSLLILLGGLMVTRRRR